MKTLRIFLMLLVVAGFMSCRKNIDVPNAECEKVFGTWRFVSASGGITGETITEQSRGYTETVEFTRKGIVHWRKNGKKEKHKFLRREKFSFTVASSIYTHALSNQVVMTSGNKTILFGSTADTLTLLDEAYDGYSTKYVKQ